MEEEEQTQGGAVGVPDSVVGVPEEVGLTAKA